MNSFYWFYADIAKTKSAFKPQHFDKTLLNADILALPNVI